MAGCLKNGLRIAFASAALLGGGWYASLGAGELIGGTALELKLTFQGKTGRECQFSAMSCTQEKKDDYGLYSYARVGRSEGVADLVVGIPLMALGFLGAEKRKKPDQAAAPAA